MLKNYCLKHNCNDDNDIGRRKQQKLDFAVFGWQHIALT